MISPGMRFGRLRTLYSIAGIGPYVMWCCECDCGNYILRASKNIKSGQIKSCGCLRREATASRSIIHGQYKTGTYKSWAQMIQRCADEGNPRYGGRGIRVCDAWQQFDAFYADMGDRPQGMTLDRINADGNYEPGNCRWATREQQDSNKGNSLNTIYQGKRVTAAEFARLTGIPKSTVRRRILDGFIFAEGKWVEGTPAAA